MKLLGNSVSVPLIQKLIQAIKETGVFEDQSAGKDRVQPHARELPPQKVLAHASLFD